MKLGTKQQLFSRCLAQLLVWAHGHGYEVRMGEVWRHPAAVEAIYLAGKGIKNTNHARKLAVDINLFKNGKFLTKTEDHAPLGAYWKSLHPLCRWGGDFRHRDGNHYSLFHNGVA